MINIDDLLFPITAENECGEYLRYDAVYDQLKELRREDDPRLTQGIWEIEPKKANWPEVEKICAHLLSRRTKDLQIAAWLAEALTALHGLTGLSVGVLLLHKLCEKFWDGISPPLDPQNQNARARMIPLCAWVDRVDEKILMIPLAKPLDNISEDRNLSDWIVARHNMHIKYNKGLSIRDLRKSVTSTPVEFLQQIEADLQEALDNIKVFDSFLMQKCQMDSPSFRKIYDHFKDIQQINSKNLSNKKSQLKDEAEQQSQSPTTKGANDRMDFAEVYDAADASSDSSTPEGTTVAASRNNHCGVLSEAKKNVTLAQAYTALNDIAMFLEHNQPQSPVATVVKIANAMKEKTFLELMEINMQNGMTAMSAISELYKVFIKNNVAS
jgi:type VI secretion system ImpA family protein